MLRSPAHCEKRRSRCHGPAVLGQIIDAERCARGIDDDVIEARKQLDISLMPPGLAATITEQEFVDLVEYLSGLRKK